MPRDNCWNTDGHTLAKTGRSAQTQNGSDSRGILTADVTLDSVTVHQTDAPSVFDVQTEYETERQPLDLLVQSPGLPTCYFLAIYTALGMMVLCHRCTAKLSTTCRIFRAPFVLILWKIASRRLKEETLNVLQRILKLSFPRGAPTVFRRVPPTGTDNLLLPSASAIFRQNFFIIRGTVSFYENLFNHLLKCKVYCDDSQVSEAGTTQAIRPCSA